MTALDELLRRNAEFADTRHDSRLGINPTLRTVIVACVDPRVDPGVVLRLELGETVTVRNLGGRVTPETLQTLVMLSRIGQANGDAPGSGWNLVLLQHTDCGITDLAPFPALLASYFGVDVPGLEAKSIGDPRSAISGDVELLRGNGALPSGLLVSGLVYDVRNGLVEVVVPPDLLGHR
jgi:carbonic anhydrase